MNSKRNYLNKSYIEIINPNITRGKIKFAIFDFDGTISLIREGSGTRSKKSCAPT